MDMNAKQRYTSVVQSKRRDEERKESKLKSTSKSSLFSGGGVMSWTRQPWMLRLANQEPRIHVAWD